MSYRPSHGVDKAGSDSTDVGYQGASADAHVTSVAPGGDGIIAGKGGDGTAYGRATAEVDQYLDQYGTGGDGGHDNAYADAYTSLR